MTLSGSPFDCDCLVALLSVTLPGSRVCIVLRWYKKYIEDIQVFGVNMSFISLSEVKIFYIS